MRSIRVYGMTSMAEGTGPPRVGLGQPGSLLSSVTSLMYHSFKLVLVVALGLADTAGETRC